MAFRSRFCLKKELAMKKNVIRGILAVAVILSFGSRADETIDQCRVFLGKAKLTAGASKCLTEKGLTTTSNRVGTWIDGPAGSLDAAPVNKIVEACLGLSLEKLNDAQMADSVKDSEGSLTVPAGIQCRRWSIVTGPNTVPQL